MLQFNPRVGKKVEVFKPLLELFRVNYGAEQMPEIEEILRKFQALRDELVDPLPFCGDVKTCESYIAKAKEYFILHNSIFKCVNPAAFKVTLGWTDSVSGRHIVLSDPQSEQIILLFNIAIFTFNEARLMSESGNFRDAMNQFLVANEVLGKVRTDATRLKLEEIDLNFSEHYLQLGMNLCKAMVQFCMIEVKRPELQEIPQLALAKICKCASNFFQIVHGNATLTTLQPAIKKLISKNFIASLKFAYRLYDGLAYFYAARVYGDDTINKDPMKTIGYALGLIEEVKKIFSEFKDTKEILSFVKNVYVKNKDFVATKISYIEKRNKEIYRELPTTKLPIIEPLGHPKKINLEEVLQTGVPGRDVLRRIIPIKIINYEKEYKAEVESLRTKLEKEEKEREKEEKKFLEAHELFQRLFDAQDIQNNYEFPKELLAKLEKIHVKNGIVGLIDLYERMKGEIGNWNYFVARCDGKLTEEETKYATNKEKVGEAWTQAPSSEVNKHFKEGVEEGKELLEIAKSQCELFNTMVNTKSDEQALLMFVSNDINDLMLEIPKSIIVGEVAPVELIGQ